jgi:2-oxoglutarate dehydrogenase E2 component (dihydrolipoamide succinyltransferase)
MTDLLEIRMPADQSEGTRSQVLRWLKAEGDSVSQDEPLIEMETDKVTVEIAAPHAGVLRQILKPEQSDVEPGDVLGFIEAEATRINTSEVHTGNAPAATGQNAGTGSPSTLDERASDSRNHSQARSPSLPPVLEDGRTARVTASNDTANALSPAVRRLLSENGLSASNVVGTGAGGRITVDDVLSHVSQLSRGDAERGSLATATAQRLAPAQVPSPSAHSTSGTRRVPHSAVRKRVAEHMVRSLMHTAPHVTSVFEADMSAVIAHRTHHREEYERSGAPLTFTAYFLSAIVDAIRAVPEANSRWTDDALEIYDAIHIGVGTALGDQGLVVPVVRHVESLTLQQIAVQLHDVVSRARSGELTPEDVRGGTFTISNHGVSGSLIATPIIINQPQSAILGIGKLDQRVVPAKEGSSERFTVVPKCYITLTIDHRVMDGFQANRFLQTFVGKLENW